MNSPWSSCNIRPGPVFIQQATHSFACNTQEEMKRVNSPFRMLNSIMGGTKSSMNGTSIFGFQKHICFPSLYITPLCTVLMWLVLYCKPHRKILSAICHYCPSLIQSNQTFPDLDGDLCLYFCTFSVCAFGVSVKAVRHGAELEHEVHKDHAELRELKHPHQNGIEG